MPASRPMEVRFWEKVNKDGPVPEGKFYEGLGKCWVFNGGTTIAYPNSHRTSGPPKAVAWRYSYELHHGKIPKGQVVRHKCDNGHLKCVNPAHLELGTQKDNIVDRYKRRVLPFQEITDAMAVAATEANQNYDVPVRLLALAMNVRRQGLVEALRRPHLECPRKKVPDISPEEVERAIDLIVNQGYTMNATATEIGRWWPSLNAALKKAGFDYKSFYERRRADFKANCIEMFRVKDMKLIEIAHELNSNVSQVRRAIYEP